MGRTSLLAFLGDIEKRAQPPRDLSTINDDYDNHHTGAGGYILLAQGRTTWAYPWGRSPVFYIGKSGRSIRERVWEHWDGARHAKASQGDSLYYAVNHYTAEFSPRYVAIPTWQRMTPDSVEEELLGRFVKAYGARPVANNQTRWKRA
jgi:hypothetical protein